MTTVDISKIKSIHLIAICGTGMGALAGILKENGFSVTGSDQNVYPPMSLQLEKMGITIMPGYDPSHVSHKPDLVIIGNAIRRENPEAQAAIKEGIPYLSFPDSLHRFYLSKKRTIAVCGTHGKTTTTALLAHIFVEAGLDPSFLVGGVLQNFGKGFRVGQGDDFVIEGDEYDTAFFDKVPKFIRYKPEWAVVGNIEFDHADIYDDLDQIKNQFELLLKTMPKNGLVFAGSDCPNVNSILNKALCPVFKFGLENSADYRPGNWEIVDGVMKFQVYRGDQSLGEFECSLTGEHNLKNILAAIAVCDKAKIPVGKSRKALSTFKGIKRRQQVRGIVGGVTVVDDFAHHPTAVKATLESMKKTYSRHRIVAVFEPRTNTSRRNFFQQQYAKAFKSADIVFIAPVFGLEDISSDERFDPEKLVADLNTSRDKAYYAESLDMLPKLIMKRIRIGDIIVFMSNGGFGRVHEKVIECLKEGGE